MISTDGSIRRRRGRVDRRPYPSTACGGCAHRRRHRLMRGAVRITTFFAQRESRVSQRKRTLLCLARLLVGLLLEGEAAHLRALRALGKQPAHRGIVGHLECGLGRGSEASLGPVKIPRRLFRIQQPRSPELMSCQAPSESGVRRRLRQRGNDSDNSKSRRVATTMMFW